MVREQIKAMSIQALRDRDKVTRARLSGVLADFTAREKDADFTGWTEQSEREIVGRYSKRLLSSLKDLKGTELGDSYEAEAALLEPFGPQLLDEAATRALLEPLVGKVKGVGPVMGRIMKTHKGLVDPSLVRKLAAELGLL